MPVRTDITKYRNLHKQNVYNEYKKNPEKFLVTKKEENELLEKQKRVKGTWNKVKSIFNMEETRQGIGSKRSASVSPSASRIARKFAGARSSASGWCASLPK